jgi:hypothetical protein
MSEDLASLQAFVSTMVRRVSPLGAQADACASVPVVCAGSALLSPVEQLDVYREQFWLRHIGSLDEDYPTLKALLGERGFEELCQRYLGAFPPDVFSLRDLAAKMAQFVEENAPYAEDPLLAECAKTEWAFIEAFDAADVPPFDASVIASTPEDAWEGAVLHFHPSLRILRLAYPTHEYRRAVRSSENPARPEAAPTHLVVFRQNETVHYLAIDALPFALVERLLAGEALGSACEQVATQENAVGIDEQIAGWFQTWVAYGWLSAIRV